MSGWNFARGQPAWLALSPLVFCECSQNLAAQEVAACNGWNLEQAIRVHPVAGAYDALGHILGNSKQYPCDFRLRIGADPDPHLEAHFNPVSPFCKSQPHLPRELRIAGPVATRKSSKPRCVGVALRS